MAGSMRDAMDKAGVQVPPRRRGSGRHGGGGGRSGGGGGRRRVPELPDSYFRTDSHGHSCLRHEFVSRRTLDPYVRAFATSKPRLTTAQMRRFFNHCREMERLLTVEGYSWERVAARFASISAHAHNAAAANKIPAKFRGFVDEHVDRVLASDNPREAFLTGFLRHFEALVGFSAGRLQ